MKKYQSAVTPKEKGCLSVFAVLVLIPFILLVTSIIAVFSLMSKEVGSLEVRRE